MTKLQMFRDMFALLGVVFFTWLVTKYGLLAGWTKLRSWFSSGESEVEKLWKEVRGLKAVILGMNTPPGVQPATGALGATGAAGG